MISTRRLALALGATLALATCGAPKGGAAGRTYTVTIAQLAYVPRVVTAQVGDTIVWDNKDILRHTATDAGGAFDFDLVPGATARTILTTPGAIKYVCRYHPGMTGEINVASRG